MAVGEASGLGGPRRVVSAGGGRRRPEMGEPGAVPAAAGPSQLEPAVVAEREIVTVDPELERLLQEEEEIERRTRGDHHETPHFPRD